MGSPLERAQPEKMDISPGQRLALIKMAQACGVRDRAERLWWASRLLGRPVETFNDLTHADWRRIRDYAYPKWGDGDWEVGQKMVDKSALILRRYRGEVLGQLSLFGVDG